MTSWKIFADFAAKKITADTGCVRMLIDNARFWRRLRALWSCNELTLNNHSAFLNVVIL